MSTGISIIKRFAYRGNALEEWSNKYHFTGTDPATPADWLALFTALTTQEKTLYASSVEIIRGYGYTDDASTANNVWSRDLTAAGNTTIPGTLSTASLTVNPGDTAAWIRWKTSRLSSPGGKPIYLRKYYHPAYSGTGGTRDTIGATWTTPALAFAAKLWDGSFIDARVLRAPGHSSETILGASVSQFTTVRTLKRRGKRPKF